MGGPCYVVIAYPLALFLEVLSSTLPPTLLYLCSCVYPLAVSWDIHTQRSRRCQMPGLCIQADDSGLCGYLPLYLCTCCPGYLFDVWQTCSRACQASCLPNTISPGKPWISMYLHQCTVSSSSTALTTLGFWERISMDYYWHTGDSHWIMHWGYKLTCLLLCHGYGSGLGKQLHLSHFFF